MLHCSWLIGSPQGISPKELVELLNMLYSAFDEAIWDWGLHKVDPWSAKHQMGSLETYP